jgi:hypothetical protein
VVTIADGYAEREAAKAMMADAVQAKGDPDIEITLGADKGYDAEEFIKALQEMKVTPHVAQNTSGRKSAVPDAIAATVGYRLSQQKRKLIAQGFGWAKVVGAHDAGDGAWAGESRSDVCVDDDRLQPHAHAHLGANPSAEGVRGRKSPEMGSQVSQGEQKAKEISKCVKKIRKIKVMRREIALAHGVFQQPARVNPDEKPLWRVYIQRIILYKGSFL